MVVVINILEHVLVPKFRILSEEEKKGVLERFKTTDEKLPKILSTDPVAKKIQAKSGDLLEIERNSEVAGKSIYYRIVVES